jgi:hypothetical protein
MLVLLVTAIASKFDDTDYATYVKDGTIPAVLKRGASPWASRYENFWAWAIKHQLRSVFSSVAPCGTVTAKTMLSTPGILAGNSLSHSVSPCI